MVQELVRLSNLPQVPEILEAQLLYANILIFAKRFSERQPEFSRKHYKSLRKKIDSVLLTAIRSAF